MSLKGGFSNKRLFWLGCLPIIGIACLWELAGGLGWINIRITPPPSSILERVISIITQGEVLQPFLQTTYLLFGSFIVASAVGTGLGLLIGRSAFAYNLFNPLLELIRPLPKPALLPPLMLFLGIGMVMKMVVVCLAIFFPVLINTVQGVRSVDPNLVNVGRTLRVGPMRTTARIIAPAALPYIFTGMRVGLGLGLIVVVIAEMLAGTGGLGYLIIDMQRSFKIVDMYAWLLILAVFGFSINYLFVRIERRILHWNIAVSG